MMDEQFVPWDGTTSYRLARLSGLKTLIVFFHGIGDSHLNYRQFFTADNLNQYDLCVVDLLGHGCSSAARYYNFEYQCRALDNALKSLVVNYDHVIFVPHSMGGIHATMLALDHFSSVVSGLFAVETCITQYGSFIAKQVTDLVNNSGDYNRWFSAFLDDVYYKLGKNSVALRVYYAGLQLVRPDAFKQNAIEMYALATACPEEEFTSRAGHDFLQLPVPKVYCLGAREKNAGNKAFLNKYQVPVESFRTDSHWVAQNAFGLFCKRLYAFAESCAV